MDTFDRSYTPNHDDHMLRYSYSNQVTIIWWNLVRFGEAIGELMGAGAKVDDETFVSEGVKEGQEEDIVSRAEKLIMQTGEEYKATALAEYQRLMTARLGLREAQKSDYDELISAIFTIMETLELDFSHFFRRLSGLKLEDLSTPEARKEKASLFFHQEGPPKTVTEGEARDQLATWLDKWRSRIIADWQDGEGSVSSARDQERMQAMKQVNPNFVPRGWILDEVIRRVEKDGERDVLDRVMHMALNPFEEAWDGKSFDGATWKGDAEEEQRWVGEVPRTERALQCSCSS